MGVLQRVFPNCIFRLDGVVRTLSRHNIHLMLSCTELRDVTICPPYVPGRRNRQFWQAIAALGRLHGSRLQLQVLKPGAFRMLAAEPLLAAHVSQADLRCHPAMPWNAADVASSLSSLTKLTLRDQDSVLGHAGMLDALRQLSALQCLHCPGDVMQTLLAKSVPCSWSLLTKLQLETFHP